MYFKLFFTEKSQQIEYLSMFLLFKKTFYSHMLKFFKVTLEVKKSIFDEFIFCSDMKQYSVWNIRVNF